MFKRVAIGLLTVGTGASAGYAYPPFDMVQNFESPLPKKFTKEAHSYSSNIDKDLLKLPIVKKLMQDNRYECHRAWSNDPDKDKSSIFTAGTLRNEPGGLNITPLVFVDKENKSTISIAHCGRKLTGFPLIVHGGILGTLLDEALGRTAFLSFDEPVGVTANLTLNYKSPTMAHQFLIVKTSTDESNTTNKKAKVMGTIETVNGKKLVEAEGLFVVPRNYKLKSMKGL